MWSHRRATHLIANKYPNQLDAFEEAIRPLRTQSDFQLKSYHELIDAPLLGRLRRMIKELNKGRIELHELPSFRRFIVHNHEMVSEVQAELIDRVSEGCGERVEASYNFLSLYRSGASCPIHMDSPEAKWTLDVCISQSEPWPIYLSQVLPWPEDFKSPENDWQAAIRRNPGNRFESYVMEPGQALLFSGSSQWHYRETQPANITPAFCDLVFFHFIPVGMAEIACPDNWARLFDIPELASVVVKQA